MNAQSWVFSCYGLAQALAAHYGGELDFIRNDVGTGYIVFLNGERIATVTDDPNHRDLWLFVDGRGIKSRDSWVIGDAIAFIEKTRGYLITTPTDLARRLAAYYGGTVARELSQPDICVVMLNGVRLAVVSREEDPSGLFLFSRDRGMVKPHGWMFDDAVAFVDRVSDTCAHEYESYCPRCGVDSLEEGDS